VGFENGKLVRVTVRASAAGVDQMNTLHYDLDDGTGAGEPNSPQSLADRFRDDVLPQFRALYTSGWTIQPVVVAEELDPKDPLRPRSEWVSGTPQAGTKITVGEAVAYGICAVCTLLTDHIGRRFRGRMFVGGSWDESDVSGNVFVTGTGHWTAAQNYIGSIPLEPDIAFGTSDAVARWCVYSRTQRKDGGPNYASKVVSTPLKDRIHFLRTRMPV
jgi:hypothetical protein